MSGAVLLLRPSRTDHLDCEDAIAIGCIGTAKQRAENRIAIEAGEARPHNLRVPAHERADRTVSNEARSIV